MLINPQARQRILATVYESAEGGRAYRVIGLPDGARLLLSASAGGVVYALLDAACDLGPNSIEDVTLAVIADLQSLRGA